MTRAVSSPFLHLLLPRERFPEGWLEAASRCSIDELNAVPAGLTLPDWPRSLSSFVERAGALALRRERVAVRREALSGLAPTSPQLAAAMTAGVAAKKKHEARPPPERNLRLRC